MDLENWAGFYFFLTKPEELDLQSSTWFLALTIQTKKFLKTEFFGELFEVEIADQRRIII